jgi:hypothetical protein
MPRSRPKPADRHPAKRPYQPPITHFLAPAQHSNHSPASAVAGPRRLHHHHRPHSQDEHAALDVDTQASLLHVGMRIRKAVPEGYKTHNTAAVFSMDDARRPAIGGSGGGGGGGRGGPSARRELVPFCGLHKVGGLRVQERWWPAGAPERKQEGHLPPPGGWPSSSQESSASSAGSGGGDGAAARKRGFLESSLEDEDEPEELFAGDDLVDDDGCTGSVGFARPLARAGCPGGGDSEIIISQRVIAMPRAARGLSHCGWAGQSSSGDFGEAPFLSACDDHLEEDMR